jgi:hypothetical protein
MNTNTQNTNPAFKEAVTKCLSKGTNNWTGDDSAEALYAILGSLKDSKDEPIKVTDVEKDAITIACKPTFEVQVRMVVRILESRGVLANADTRKNIERVVSPAKFKKELIKAGLIKEPGGSDLTGLLG